MPELHLLSFYDFHLPESQIAQRPVFPRDSSRLLVVHRKTGSWEHRRFCDLPEYLDQDDRVVLNNTRVIKARLLGHRVRMDLKTQKRVQGGGVEFVLLESHGPLQWEGLFRASARSVPGFQFEVPTPSGRPLLGTVIQGASESEHGTVQVSFDRDPLESGAGQLPLPPYIERTTDAEDDTSYQTVYAKTAGSAAAPTAGLHFTPEVLEEIRRKGCAIEEVTLHTGLGTFRPVKTEDIRLHPMHEERFEIDPETAKRVCEWKQAGRRILAVGTTSVRTLESAWTKTESGGLITSGPQRTSLFIRPGHFEFQVVDRVLTNFHLPKSTLFILVCTFAGSELMKAAYEEAVRKGYRFFSYGDAMLIL